MTELIDHYGNFLSYTLINRSYINNIISSNDDYLKVIGEFVQISKNENVYNAFSIENIKYESADSLIDCILNYQYQNKLLTSFIVNDDKINGFIKSFNNDYLIVSELDYISKSILSDIKIMIAEIKQIDYKSMLLYLLKDSVYSLLP